jgi:glycosyltransferase involved in cell wall biosynthesis
VCVGSYLPGYRSGGPIRSISNIVSHLEGMFEFYVVTRDRDASDVQCYPGVVPNEWCTVGNARVLYCSSVRPFILIRAFRDIEPDLVYLNSYQDAFTRIMVLLRRVGAFGETPVVLAPRGELSPAAMGIKRAKKVLYRHLAKLLGLHQNLAWHATSTCEMADILSAAPSVGFDPKSIHVAPNIADIGSSVSGHLAKESGVVKLAYVSRISEVKNLSFLLEILSQIRGHVELGIYGPVTENDSDYVQQCRKLRISLPDHIKTEYLGSIEHSEVPHVLNAYHFFVLPTKGENFCHAAVEALVNGIPVILSDRTPWDGLDDLHAGFNITLSDRTGWIAALQKCTDMNGVTYMQYLRGAKDYSRRFSMEEAVRQNVDMFESVIEAHSGMSCSSQ